MTTIYESIERAREDLNYLSLVQRQLLALIRLAITGVMDNCLAVCQIDWQKLYADAEKQSVVGIAFAGIERLPKDCLPDMDLLMDWLGQAELIKTQNEYINQKCKELTVCLKQDGFDSVVLKGQANALKYPQPDLRTSGDIDIWLSGDRKETVKYLLRTGDVHHIQFHHADWNVMKGVEVEAHFRPMMLFNYFKNELLQKVFDEEKASFDNDGGKGFNVLTYRADIYMQLVHMYRHVLFEGIGLRQMMDFAFLLKRCAEDNACWVQEKIELAQRIKKLGLQKFTGAVMYVMKELFNLDDACLLVPVDMKEGIYLVKEIMLGGNFGKYDNRYAQRGGSALRNFLVITRKNMRMFSHYPSDCVWYTIYRISQFGWRKINGYQ